MFWNLKFWEKGTLLDQSKDVPNNAIKTQSVFSFYENGIMTMYSINDTYLANEG